MKLSPNFNLKEFTYSSSAGIWIEPTDIQIERIKKLCVHILQPIRYQFGRVVITGGLRNAEVYRFLLVKAVEDRRERGVMTPLPSLTSDHFAGDNYNPKGTGAADFTIPQANLKDVFKWIVSQWLPYKQVIFYPEHKFIHISNDVEGITPRRQALIYENGDYSPFNEGKEKILSTG